MTNPTMALADLAEKGAGVDVLRQMVQFMAVDRSKFVTVVRPNLSLRH